MALHVEFAGATAIRHVFVRSHGRRVLFPDAATRTGAARRIAGACVRHELQCLVWCVTDRCLHVVVRGAAPALSVAADEFAGPRLRRGHCQSALVKPDLYLLEVARHVLQAPVRAGLCRRAADWPHSSARESLGLRAAAPWLDSGLLYDLLGPRDGKGATRLRRLLDSA